MGRGCELVVSRLFSTHSLCLLVHAAFQLPLHKTKQTLKHYLRSPKLGNGYLDFSKYPRFAETELSITFKTNTPYFTGFTI